MNATEALKLAQQNWAENEQKNMSYVIGFQNKVEVAAKEGKVQCTIGTIPSGAMDFVASFFEQMGYYTIFGGTPTPGEILVSLNWKQEPMGSRPYLEAKEFNKLF
jgi:hypothetical protein